MKYPQHDAKKPAGGLVRAVFVVVAAFSVMTLLTAQFFSSLDNLAKVMAASQFGFALWRLLLFLLLIGSWPAFTEIYANWAGWTAEQTASLKAYRWRMAGWLLVMETLFCQTLWTDFVQILQSMGTGST